MKYFREDGDLIIDIYKAIRQIPNLEKVLHEVKSTSCRTFSKFGITYFNENNIKIKTSLTDNLDSYQQDYNVLATVQEVAYVYSDDIIKKLEDRLSYCKNSEKYNTMRELWIQEDNQLPLATKLRGLTSTCNDLKQFDSF